MSVINEQSLLEPKSLTAEELKSFDSVFDILKFKPTSTEKILKTLHNYFAAKHFDQGEIKKYYTSFWKWYIDASVRRLLLIPDKAFVAAFCYLLPVAAQMDYNVEWLLWDYLDNVILLPSDQQKVFGQLRVNIAKSSVIINPLVANSWTLTQCSNNYYQAIKSKNQQKITEIQILVSKMMFPEGKELMLLPEVEKEVVIKRFLRLLLILRKNVDVPRTLESYNNFLEDYGEPGAREEVPIIIDVDSTTKIKDEDVKPNMRGVKAIIEDIFVAIDTNNFEQATAIIKRLSDLGDKFHDEKIKQLYYFNQELGKFEWNETLLKS